MHKRFTMLSTLTASLFLAWSSLANAEETGVTFKGNNNDYNLSFSVRGAWELRWQVEGDKTFPSISQFTVHLHDAATGRFLGIAAQKTGSGQGVRYIPDGGRFFVHVLGRNVRWQLEVVDVDEPWQSIPEFEGAEEIDRMKLIIIDDDALKDSEQDGEKK